MTRKAIFDAVRAARGGTAFNVTEVAVLDDCLDRLKVPREGAAPSGHRRIGAKGLALIKEFEGLKLKAYLCPAQVWTIGYGSTGAHVREGMVITEARAEELLREDLERFERGVAKLAPNATQEQFDAMVSLAFNIGTGDLDLNDGDTKEEGFTASSVLRHHRAGRHAQAAEAFALWNKAGGRVQKGLVRRRAAEAALYRSAGV